MLPASYYPRGVSPSNFFTRPRRKGSDSLMKEMGEGLLNKPSASTRVRSIAAISR